MEANKEEERMALLEETNTLLQELLSWTKVMAYPAAKTTLEVILDTPKKRRVYQALDGHRSNSQIEDATQVNTRYVSQWGQEWEKLGIVVQSRVSSVRGRRQRVFDLQAFDLDVDAEE